MIFVQSSKKNSVYNDTIMLQPGFLDSLYENQRYIKNAFLSIKGLYNIEHMSIYIINPENVINVFSTTPNIEFNLTNQGIFLKDPCFKTIKTPNKFLWWDSNNYEKCIQILQARLINNKYTCGMSLCRKLGDFNLIYSFATKDKTPNLQEYYEYRVGKIIAIGDYFFKNIRNLYTYYDKKHRIPTLIGSNARAKIDCSYLKLIVNNDLLGVK